MGNLQRKIRRSMSQRQKLKNILGSKAEYEIETDPLLGMVLDVLIHAKNPLRPEDIATVLPYATREVESALSQWIARGKVAMMRSGTFVALPGAEKMILLGYLR